MSDAFLEQRLIEILKLHALGRNNAMPRDKVLFHLTFFQAKINDRQFRALYANLGVPTCEGGLYWPTCREDLIAFKDYMRKKALPHFVRVKRTFEAFPELADGLQLDLFPDEGERAKRIAAETRYAELVEVVGARIAEDDRQRMGE